MEKKPLNILSYSFGFILCINVILRFYDFSTWSFTNDELSALFRLNFDSLSALFERGIKIDGHPALVQVLLYFWSSIFGVSEFSIRIPFVIAGIGGSLYFYYFIKEFVNQKAALLSFAALTCSQLFVLYSQIARPYSIGFFFVCSFSYYWFKLLQHPKKKSHLIGFIISGFLGIISHYFASMSISIMLVSGVFFLNKSNIKSYLAGGLGICILFIPHLKITLYQLQIGGVDWLPTPTEDFIYSFYLFVFNDSYNWQYFLLAFPIIALLSAKSNFKQVRIYLLPVLFFLPYYIAYKYSLTQSPVMQFSVLIFAVPFFLAFLFSFFSKDSNPKLIATLSILILASGLFTLIGERDFYGKKAFADFKGVSEHVIQWTEKVGSDNVVQFSNSNNPEYLNFYYKQDSNTVDFKIDQFKDLSLIKKARNLIQSSSTEYAMISFANVPVPAEVYEFVKQTFPEKIEQHKHFNSDVSLFKRSTLKRETLFESKAENSNNWNVNKSLLDTSSFNSAPNSFHITPPVEFSLSFSDTVKNVFKTNNSLVVKGHAFMQKAQKALLVFSIERNKENIYWRGMEIQSYYTEGEWFEFLNVFRKEDQILDSDLIKIYIWNPDKANFYIDDFELINFKDSDYNYYDL